MDQAAGIIGKNPAYIPEGRNWEFNLRCSDGLVSPVLVVLYEKIGPERNNVLLFLISSHLGQLRMLQVWLLILMPLTSCPPNLWKCIDCCLISSGVLCCDGPTVPPTGRDEVSHPFAFFHTGNVLKAQTFNYMAATTVHRV